MNIENMVIIGSGPAGYTAAIYAGRANLKPFVFAGFSAGGVPGGQLMTTTEVENYPGFPAGIQGPALMDRMYEQALRCGAEIVLEDVIAVDLSDRPFKVSSNNRQIKTHSIIIATGATAKRLNLPSEAKFWNKGISACAICDGAAPLFRGVELAVVGGGDTAAEEALFLTKYGSRVHMLVRRDRLRASKVMQQRVFDHAKITIHWHTEVVDAYGDRTIAGVRLRNLITNELSNLPVGGLFYAIGHKPNSNLFKGQLEMDDVGYIVTSGKSTRTNIEGVFACGDVQDHQFRQAVTAAGTGCMAAMEAERWLSAAGLAVEFATDLTVDRTSNIDSMDMMLDLAIAPLDSDPTNPNATTGLVAEFVLGEPETLQTSETSDLADLPEASATEIPETLETEAVSNRTVAVESPINDKPINSTSTEPERSTNIPLEQTYHQGGIALHQLYQDSDRLIIVKYTAPGCPPCHMLKSVLKSVTDKFADKIHVVAIDITAEPEIAAAAGIIGTPTVQFFKAQNLLGEILGLKSEQDYASAIAQYLET
jgi:thioredoxin reductase (NADPH)